MTNLLLDNPGITIFGFKIYAYAMVIVFGMLTAYFVISALFKRRNMSPDLFTTYFCICLPVALITTRLFYCITDGMPISEWFSIESIRQGGLSIIGGIIGGAVSVAAVSFFKKINFFRAGDCIVIGLLLAQGIGRWGNYFNQEVYGAEVTNQALQFFPLAVYIEAEGAWHYAFFFYESFLNILGAALMFFFAWRNGKKPNGLFIAWYFTQYGLVRTIMEPLRDPSYILSGGGVPWSLVMSITMLVFGITLFIVLFAYNKKKEGTFFGSAHSDPYGITAYIKDNKDEKAYFSKWNMMCKIYPQNYETKPKKKVEVGKAPSEDQKDEPDKEEKQ